MSTVTAAWYLASALLLRITSGYAFPLLPVAAWITAINVASLATNWSIRNVAVRLLGNLALGMAWLGLAAHRLRVEGIPGPDWAPPHQWPTLFDFPLSDYALIGAIGLASFDLAVAGVARQRHDGRPNIAWTPGTGFSDRLVSLFRSPCPISSATRAQVWFELKSSGLPLLMIGVALAIVNPLLFALSVPVESIRTFAVMCGMFSVLTVLMLGGNAFGIRGWPTHRYASAFEATRAYGTARLAAVKVLVRSVCMLAALIAVGASVGASMSLIAVGKGYEPLRSWHLAIESAIGGLTGYQQIALAAVASIGVVVMVASHAAFGSARGALSASPEHRNRRMGGVTPWFPARPAGAERIPWRRIRVALGVPAGRVRMGDTLDRRTGDSIRDGLHRPEGVRGAASDAALTVWRRRGVGGVRHG